MNTLKKIRNWLRSSWGNARANTFAGIRLIVGDATAAKMKAAIRELQRRATPHNTVQKDYERLKRIGASDIDLRLHFGCGIRILKGWINIDTTYFEDKKRTSQIHIYPEQELIGTRKDLFLIDFTETSLPLPDNSVSRIFHEDFIEHINQRDTVLFLAETFRVLKSDGIHRINTPELLGSMRRYSDFSKGSRGVFAGEWNAHGHLNILTRSYLEELARLVGYREVVFNGKNKSISPDMPRDFRQDDTREEHEQIHCDLIK